MRDCPADREEYEYGVAGDTAELHPHVRHPDLLSAHSAEEASAAPFLLPPRDVPFTGNDRLHREKVASNLVAGADCLYSLRDEDAKLENHLPVDLQEIPGKLQSESASPQGREPRSERNAREIQQGKVDLQEEQVGIQPPGGRALGIGYSSERPGQKQSLLCHPGGAQNPVLHCRVDTGPTGGDHGKRHCRCIVRVRFPFASGQDHYL